MLRLTVQVVKPIMQGAIYGQGSGHVTSNDTVIKFEYVTLSSGPNGIDVGYLTSTDATFQGENNLFISKQTLKGTWGISSYTQAEMLLFVDPSVLIALASNLDNAWLYAEGSLNIVINGQNYVVNPGVKLGKVVLSKDNLVISWAEIVGTIGYQVYLDGVVFGELQTGTTFNLGGFDAETHSVTVQAIGDQIYFASGEISEAEVVVPVTERLATPVVTLTGNVLSWGCSCKGSFISNNIKW